jgi:hypothetical protein
MKRLAFLQTTCASAGAVVFSNPSLSFARRRSKKEQGRKTFDECMTDCKKKLSSAECIKGMCAAGATKKDIARYL